MYKTDDFINKKNEQGLSSLGYSGTFPIECRQAAEFLESKFPQSVLRAGFHQWREDFIEIAREKYPNTAKEAFGIDNNLSNYRDYIIEIAISEIKEKKLNPIATSDKASSLKNNVDGKDYSKMQFTYEDILTVINLTVNKCNELQRTSYGELEVDEHEIIKLLNK
jgi:hypothetical protein